MSNIGVVIPVLNLYKYAVDCIASIRSAHNIETLIIPNYRHKWPLSRAWNYGIEYLLLDKSCKSVAVLNDDILLAPYTLDSLVLALDKPEYDLVSGANMRGGMSNPDDILTYNVEDWRNPVPVSGPDFSFFMLNFETFNKVGRFDENFIPAYFEDNDYHQRMKILGLNGCSINTAPFYHIGSQTQNADPKNPACPPTQFIQNRKYYITKWGGEPGRERFKTPFNDSKMTVKDW